MCGWLKKLLEENVIFFIAYLSITSAIAYMGSYFVRSPIYIIPMNSFPTFWGVDFKTCLTLSSEFGKLVSKLLGMFIVSRINRQSRLVVLIIFNVVAMCLISLPFAFLDPIYQLVGTFLAMCLLSSTYGIIVLYYEGRRITETLGTLSAISYLFGTGAAKSTGAFFLNYISPRFMPLTVACTFLPISIICMILLDMVPEPTREDVAHRSKRSKMSLKDQFSFMWTFNLGIFVLMVLNLCTLLVRNFRDYFAPEIYQYGLKTGVPEETYLAADAFGGAIAILTGIFLPKVARHKVAFFIMIGLTLLGGLILVGFTFMFEYSILPGLPWLLSIAAGMWIVYLPINSGAMWDRLFAISRIHGTDSFLIYAVDILGGVGTIVLMFWKLFFFHSDPGSMFVILTMVVGSIVCVGSLILFGYFYLVFKYYPDTGAEIRPDDDQDLLNYK